MIMVGKALVLDFIDGVSPPGTPVVVADASST